MPTPSRRATEYGDLIAHPDLSLVLQQWNLAHLGQVEERNHKLEEKVQKQVNELERAGRLHRPARFHKFFRKTLAKIENLVGAEPLGEMQLKGFSRSVTTFNISKLK